MRLLNKITVLGIDNKVSQAFTESNNKYGKNSYIIITVNTPTITKMILKRRLSFCNYKQLTYISN